MTYTVEIPDHTADALVGDILTSDLKNVRQDIARLMSKAELMEFETRDLCYYQELEQAFRHVIKYYTAPDKWHMI